jgi:hypothetical protein
VSPLRRALAILRQPAVATAVTILLEFAILSFTAWAFLHAARHGKGV